MAAKCDMLRMNKPLTNIIPDEAEPAQVEPGQTSLGQVAPSRDEPSRRETDALTIPPPVPRPEPETAPLSPLAAEVARRRTFAIISHPDAGKTTLTEKLLLFGGAINLAGQVKAKGERRNTRSDWMKIERERGISVVTSVMTFDYRGIVFNLLDTPGHEDFSEDTYRTLTAVDSAVMVIDAAKGIEARTRKLFEVCRLRDIPIITFINKMDRESRDPFDHLGRDRKDAGARHHADDLADRPRPRFHRHHGGGDRRGAADRSTGRAASGQSLTTAPIKWMPRRLRRSIRTSTRARSRRNSRSCGKPAGRST